MAKTKKKASQSVIFIVKLYGVSSAIDRTTLNCRYPDNVKEIFDGNLMLTLSEEQANDFVKEMREQPFAALMLIIWQDSDKQYCSLIGPGLAAYQKMLESLPSANILLNATPATLAQRKSPVMRRRFVR